MEYWNVGSTAHRIENYHDSCGTEKIDPKDLKANNEVLRF